MSHVRIHASTIRRLCKYHERSVLPPTSGQLQAKQRKERLGDGPGDGSKMWYQATKKMYHFEIV